MVAEIKGAKARLGHRGGSHEDDCEADKLDPFCGSGQTCWLRRDEGVDILRSSGTQSKSGLPSGGCDEVGQGPLILPTRSCRSPANSRSYGGSPLRSSDCEERDRSGLARSLCVIAANRTTCPCRRRVNPRPMFVRAEEETA